MCVAPKIEIETNNSENVEAVRWDAFETMLQDMIGTQIQELFEEWLTDALATDHALLESETSFLHAKFGFLQQFDTSTANNEGPFIPILRELFSFTPITETMLERYVDYKLEGRFYSVSNYEYRPATRNPEVSVYVYVLSFQVELALFHDDKYKYETYMENHR